MATAKSRSNQKFKFKFLVALLFILVGVLLLFRNMGWISSSNYQIIVSWKTLLMLMGIYTLTRRHYFTGFLLFILGGVFLLPELQVLSINLSLYVVPAFLILVGLSIFIKWSPSESREEGFKTGNQTQCRSAEGFYKLKNIFSGVRQVVFDAIFKGAFIRNFFGGAVLDLRNTHLRPGETYIDINSKFGGVQLYVPSHWKIEIRIDSFIGGCEDKRDISGEPDKNSVLIIRGQLFCSGIEIKS